MGHYWRVVYEGLQMGARDGLREGMFSLFLSHVVPENINFLIRLSLSLVGTSTSISSQVKAE